MTRPRIYLDHAATTPVLPAARAAWLDGMERWANPSSPHADGRAARAALEAARAEVAAALGWGGTVIFTSGASEALALAISRSVQPLSHVSAVEHDAVMRLAGDMPRWPVAPGSGLLTEPSQEPFGLVALQQVNNETGVIQPLDSVAARIRGAGGLLLADCAQSAGKLPLPDADLIAISAHKFGGPIGIGALLVRDLALLHATGGQERGYRPGTENLPGALAMAAALRAGNAWLGEAARLRARLESALVAAGAEIVAADAPRLPTIGAIRMPGRAAQVQLIHLDAMGFSVSAGAACASGSLKPSHALAAMAQPGAGEVIRVSIGRETTEAEIDAFIAAWREIAGR